MVSALSQQKLKSLVRNISRSRLCQQGLAEEVQILEIHEKPLVYSSYMALILLSGREVRVTFKAHFKLKNAQLLAAPLYNLPPQQVKASQGQDCMREFCNLTAGGLKKALLPHMELHLSLPILTNGFDEVFFAAQMPAGSIEDRWVLAYRDNQIICSSAIEWAASVNLESLDENQDCGTENNSQVEFL